MAKPATARAGRACGRSDVSGSEAKPAGPHDAGRADPITEGIDAADARSADPVAEGVGAADADRGEPAAEVVGPDDARLGDAVAERVELGDLLPDDGAGRGRRNRAKGCKAEDARHEDAADDRCRVHD